MRHYLATTFGGAILAVGMMAGAEAAPITFFGENVTPAATVSGDPVTARANFLATLSGGVGTEDFESLSGSTPLALNFPGSTGGITATLTGSAVVQSSPNAGRFATSGSRYLQTSAGGNFGVAFSSAISAFGFYATDLGDFGNQLILRLTDTDGIVTSLAVPHIVGSGGNPDGTLVFFGFIDLTTAYTSIAFDNQPGGVDVFGFDDMTIGDRRQIVNPPSEIPLPAAGWFMVAGLGGLAALRRRRKAV
ncbi:MAG: VPLPA-CTERM sorting domain-containing protein [Gemmobacter sp.]